jgi:hypothetical protein
MKDADDIKKMLKQLDNEIEPNSEMDDFVKTLLIATNDQSEGMKKDRLAKLTHILENNSQIDEK